jgi:hypothetical protein
MEEFGTISGYTNNYMKSAIVPALYTTPRKKKKQVLFSKDVIQNQIDIIMEKYEFHHGGKKKDKKKRRK